MGPHLLQLRSTRTPDLDQQHTEEPRQRGQAIASGVGDMGTQTRRGPRSRRRRSAEMTEYNFRLLLEVAHEPTDAELDALYGLTDSEASFGSDDSGWYAEFDREAP